MDAIRVISRPHNSEKSHELVESGNTYVFEVEGAATKTDIKNAVQEIFGVRVCGVRTIVMPSKTRRYGRKLGQTGTWKKAIVRVAEGQSIEALR